MAQDQTAGSDLDIAASGATLLVGLALAIAMLPAPNTDFGTAAHLAAYLRSDMFDARWQKLGHLVLLLGVATGFLLGPRLRAIFRGPMRKLWMPGLVALVALQLYAATWSPMWSALGLATLVGGIGAALHLNSKRELRLPVLGLLIGCLAMLTIVPAFLGRMDLSTSPGSISYIDLHYAAVVEPGHRAAAGERPYTDFAVFYGGGPTALVAMVDRLFGASDLARDMVLVATCQTTVALLFVMALLSAGSKRPSALFWGLCAALTAFPAASQALSMPNLSGLRFAALALAVLVMRNLHRVPDKAAAPLLGSVCGVALLWNPETGFAVVGGAMGWLAVRISLGQPTRLAAAWGTLSIVAAATALALAALLPLLLGFSVAPNLSNLLFFAGGHFGEPIYASPLLVASAAHATALLLAHAMRPEPASPRAAGRAALASMLLVWIAYFANRPDPVNEVVYLALWGIVVADSWPRVSNETRGTAGAVRLMAFLVLLPGMLAQLERSVVWSVHYTLEAVRGPEQPDAQLVSGVWLAKSEAEANTRQIDALADEDHIWLAANAAVMAHGVSRYPSLSVCSPFGDTRSTEEVDSLKARLAAEPRVLVQDTRYGGYDERMSGFFDDMATHLGTTHQELPSKPGWRVFERDGVYTPETDGGVP